MEQSGLCEIRDNASRSILRFVMGNQQGLEVSSEHDS